MPFVLIIAFYLFATVLALMGAYANARDCYRASGSVQHAFAGFAPGAALAVVLVLSAGALTHAVVSGG